MAYGIKYKLEFSDVYSNTTGNYVANIYRKDYTGPAVYLNGTGTPLVIETEREGDYSFNPVISSIATVNILLKDASGLNPAWEDVDDVWDLYDAIWGATGLDITDIIDANIDDYYLELKRGVDVIWKGYLITTSDTTFREIEPIEFSLIFSDSSLIRAEKYFESDDAKEVQYHAKDIISIQDLLIECLESFELFDDFLIELPWEFYAPYSGINSEGNVVPTYLDLSEVYVMKNSLMNNLGDYMFKYDILKDVCSQYGLMCYQKYGKLYISSYENLVNNNTRTYKTYTIGTGFTGTSTVTDTPVALNSSTFRNLNRTQVIRYSQPTKYLSISSNASVTTNNINAFFWGKNTYYDPLDPTLTPIESFAGYDLISLFVEPEIAVYASSPTAPYDFRFGLKLTVLTTTFNTAYYMISNTPVSVDQGDVVSISSKFVYDARRDGIGDEVYVKTALVYITEDIDGNPVTFYYDDVSNIFVSTETQLTLDDVKNIKIPSRGNLYYKIYSPYCANFNPALDPYYAYGKYAIIQTYRSNNIQGVYNQQASESYYDSIKLNQQKRSLDSVTLIPDINSYVSVIPYNGNVFTNTQYLASTIGNCLLTKDYDSVIDYDEVGIPGVQRQIGESIQKNNGLPNMVIEGDYKSSLYWIGDKFTYSPITYGNVNFVLLDFKMDFKAANQSSILYSSEFKNTTGLNLVNKIITS